MKVFLVLLLCLGLVGCTASTRLTRLKDKGENVVTVEVKGDISKAKELVKEVAKELKLIDRPSEETENFIIVNSNQVKGAVIKVISGGTEQQLIIHN